MNYSLHIGVNKYNPAVWGSDANLRGCVADADAMALLAKDLGYKVSGKLLDQYATKANVELAIRKAAAEVLPGETFLLSYSGHGTQVHDSSGEERDRLDEAICLHDDLLLDDELVNLLALFKEGVKINVVADTCHSEDQVRRIFPPGEEMKPRFIKAIVDLVRPKPAPVKVAASVIQYAACKTTEVAWDTPKGGAFTRALLEIARGRKRKSAAFIDAVRRSVKNQTPSLTLNNASRAHRMMTALQP